MADANPQNEGNETPDFRSYQQLFKEHAKDVAAYPSEVLTVLEEKKLLRALDRTLFEDTSANYGFVAFSKAYLAQEWCITNSRTDTAKLKSKASLASKLPEQSFEIDDSLTASNEQSDPTIQKWLSEEIDAQGETPPIIPLVHQIAMPEHVTSTPVVKPYEERLGEEVAIEAVELSFAFGSHEPFFCTLALYDADAHRKISEDFVFQLNTPEQLAMIGVQESQLTPTVQTKKCIFRLSPTSKHSQIYAFLIVSKVLTGELDETYDIYSKPTANWKEKELKKTIAGIHETCGRLSKYRQNFVWGVAPIFTAEGTYLGESNYSMELCKVKSDMWSLVDEVRQGKKLKTIPGFFKFNMTTKPNPQVYFNRMTPTLAPVWPVDEKQIRKTKEVQEFTSTNEYPYPWVNYVNNYYVYLQKIDLSALSGRNICVEVKFMDSDLDPDAPGMPVIYANCTCTTGPLVDRYYSSVQYHNQVPKMLDEIAIKLPTQVTEKHHLLFTFYHVNVAVKKTNEAPQVLARTFVRLLEDHQIIRQKHIIPIASRLMPTYTTKDEAASWIDNKKGLLTIYARVISSVYPLDGSVHKALRSVEWDPKVEWTRIIGAMKGLFDESANQRQIVRYLPIIMRTLFQHLTSSVQALSREAFDTILNILESVTKLTKAEDGILDAYVAFVFNADANRTNGERLYQRLLENWTEVLNDAANNLPKALLCLKYSHILVGLTLKSVVFHLQEDNASKGDKDPNNGAHERRTSTTESKLQLNLQSQTNVLGQEWARTATQFISVCGEFVKEHYKNVNVASILPGFHVQLATLLGEIISLMDKGDAFELIWNYFGCLNLGTIDMFAYKAMMLKILAQRVDFAAMNIPSSVTFSNVRDIPKLFMQRHFLVGLMLKQFELAYVTNNPLVRNLVLDLISGALYTHECDTRIKNKAKIIQAYFPFVLMVIDRFDILKMASEEEKAKTFACLLVILKYTATTFLTSYWRKESERRIFTFFELLRNLIDQFEWNGLEEFHEQLKTKAAVVTNPRLLPYSSSLPSTEGDDVVLTSDSRGTLARQASTAMPKAAVIKDKKRKNSKAPTPVHRGESKLSNSSSSPSIGHTSAPSAGAGADVKGSNSQPNMLPASGPSSPSLNPVSPRKITITSASKSKESKKNMKKDVAISSSGFTKEATLASNLSYQVGVTVLDVMQAFVQSFDGPLQRRDVFEQAFGVLIHLLETNQSSAFLTLLLKKWFFLIPKWGERLFVKRNSICSDLISEIMAKCNSRVPQTRNEAVTVLCKIFSTNQQIAKNVDRSRLQSTIGITKMVGHTSGETFGRLFSSFAVVHKYFMGENKLIANVIHQLDSKIRSIVTDNLKIRQFEYDPETIVDLYYGISKQLLDHPDERITWLGNLAEFHKQRNQLEESAITKILTAALVQQYLANLQRWEAKMVPVFEMVCPSVHDECEMPTVNALMTLKHEVCQASVFSADGFAELVQQAIEMLKKAGLLELAVAAYRMLLPIYQMSENYKMQQVCHMDLYQLCGQLNDENQMKQRIFSNYYRVSFWGQNIGSELNGQTFIYREKNVCRLAEFTERLKEQFSSHFGAGATGTGSVVIVPNAQVINPAELDPDKVYIQIGTVELFLTPEQLDERNTAFKQHFGANRFVFEQPFTRAGSLRGDSLAEQCLRRTIYTTARAFPFPKKRVKVIEQKDQELSPIEYAQALISKKLTQLKGEMNVATPNLKTLQRELQGTLLTQVNAGAGAIIQTFLADDVADKYPDDQRNALADVVIEFDRALLFATKLNKSYMDPTADQTLLQEELEKGHTKFHDSIESCTIIGSRHASRRQAVVDAAAEEEAMANKKLDGPKKVKSALLEHVPGPASNGGSLAPSKAPTRAKLNLSGK